MSQRVWICTNCGWRSTAENVERKNGSFGRGEAPPHCRRCKNTALTVAREKHPRITHVCKNQACRQDFIGHVGAKYCDRCRPVFKGQKTWDGRRKWIWTPERDQILRDHYKNNPTEIARRFGWPKWVVSHRAQFLGLCRTKEKPWSKGEDAFLLEWAGVHTPHWMQKQLLNRTVTAIIIRLKRLHVSRRIQADGMTLSQLEQALGVDHRQIVGWWKRGRLKGTYRTNPNEHERYEFQEADVARFLLDNPLAFRLDRVDQAWFMALMRDANLRVQETSPGTSDVGDDSEAQRSKSARDARPSRKRHTPPRMAAADLMPCAGVDGETPCPHGKTVVAKAGIPPRCPDCTLELRRRLRLEQVARNPRPPFEWDDDTTLKKRA